MKVREFTHKDTASTNKWLVRHGRKDLKTECCRLGFIVPGVAAVQLIHAENGLAIMDSLISNALVSSTTRHKAMDALFIAFKSRAKALGYKRVIGFTTSNDTLSRTYMHGFSAQPHILLSTEL